MNLAKRFRCASSSSDDETRETDLVTTSSCGTIKVTDLKVLKDFIRLCDQKVFEVYQSDTTSANLLIEVSLQDIDDPVSDNPALGVGGWGLKPCAACVSRQHRSSLEQKVKLIDFSRTKLGIIPDVIPRKLSSFVKHAAIAASSNYSNGDSKVMLFLLLLVTYENWLCSHHFHALHLGLPGTYREAGGVNTRVVAENGTVVHFRGSPDLSVSSLSHHCEVMLNVGEVKKGWKNKEQWNRIDRDELKESDIGQLLAYLAGHSASCISQKIEAQPMLGLFMEGSKIVMVRAITSMTSPGKFRLRLGICPGGKKCLEAHSSIGLLTLMTTSCRFISNHVIVEQNVESESTVSSGRSTPDAV